MNTMIKKTVGIMLVVTCMMGTTAFADGNQPPNENDFGKEVVEVMEGPSAFDLIGDSLDRVSGPDKEDIIAILADIDYYNSVGNYEMAEELWGMVEEMLSHYGPVDPDQPDSFFNDDEEPMEPGDISIEDIVAAYEEEIGRLIDEGNDEAAAQVREELDAILAGFMGDDGFDDNQNSMEPGDESIDGLVAELEEEIGRLEETGDFEAAEQLRAELEEILTEGMGHGEPGEPGDEPMEGLVNELEEEIRILEEAGDFEAAEQLRAELDSILNGFGNDENFHNEGGFEEPDTWTIEDLIESLQGCVDPIDFEQINQLLDEIRALEEAGDHEAADQVRGELEGFVNELMNKYDMDKPGYEGDEEFMGHDGVTMEDILNKIGHDIPEEKIERLEDLVNQINELLQEEVIF